MNTVQFKEDIFNAVSKFEYFLTNYKDETENATEFFKQASTFIIVIMEKCIQFCGSVKLSKHEHFAIVIQLMQYYATYDFFKRTCSRYKNHTLLLREVNRCVCKQFINISKYVKLVFHKADNDIGSFINLMDMGLDKIAEIDINKGLSHAHFDLEKSACIVEEILCFAMSVAQVAFSNDDRIITAGCQMVLSNLESLKDEINKEEQNLAMFNLLVDTYTNALCSIEAKVNIAVLKLCLKVFSEYRQHVATLYDACESQDTNIDCIISEFDLYMDRIFQIGLFSLACSSINKRTADIKVTMSNLQFLEQEMVPAFVAMSTTNLPHRKAYANIFKKSWCMQVKNLRTAVHNIIEPEAYCKLIYEELKNNLEIIWDQVLTGNLVQKTMLDSFYSYTKELGKMIKISMNSFDNDLKEKVSTKLQVLYNVLQELTVSAEVLLQSATLNNVEDINRKIFKRCKILVSAIKDLQVCLSEDSFETDQESSAVQHKTINNEQTYVTENKTLENIIAKSRILIKNRSMCTTIAHGSVSNTSFGLNINRERHLKIVNQSVENDIQSTMESILGDFRKSFNTS